MSLKPGKVYLVGAGPGDPGLITLRGIQCLLQADVVLYDGLCNPQLLDHAQTDCLRICVGKHGASRIWTQREIDREIVRYALDGKCVVRLKGGDTAIFARTAEELDSLLQAKITFEVVPGITAALAAASYTGIPLTHRDWASAVALVTGQSQAIDGGPEAEEMLDWPALAKFPGTLVFYMGVTSSAHWSQQLIACGKSPTTPVALVRRCTWEDQQIIHCQLQDVAHRLTPASAFRPPVISIVGEVATLGPTLDWFTKRPLFGTTILVTRPLATRDSLVEMLREQGSNVLLLPAICIQPVQDMSHLDTAIRRISKFDWLVFTSRNGVEHFLARLHQLGKDARHLHRLRIAAVGPATAQALREWHVECDLVPRQEYQAESLAKALQEVVAEQRCLLVRTNRGRATLVDALRVAAQEVEEVVAYESIDVQQVDQTILHKMTLGQIDFTTVTSDAIAQSLVRLFGDKLRKTNLISISSLTSQSLRTLGFEPRSQADQATSEGLLDTILQIVANGKSELLSPGDTAG